MRRSHALAEAGVLLVLALAVTLAACSGDSSDPSAGPGDPGTSEGAGATDAPAPPVETEAAMGRVTGQLPQEKRSKVRDQVAHAVDAWFDAAYVGGDYPRNDFADAWPGFTSGAQAEAQGDKALMSNQDIGADIAGVEATARKVTVDVLAVRGKTSGATARFVLKFRTDGEVQRKVEVRGRLFLTPEADGWHIFGYDVTKGRWA
ncbi:MAG TPA: hypothetical protein VN759_11655 [Pseudolysinimonas sp.]|nr:hypothetical protein [Pseudolysinimonas sp.]